MTQFNSEEHKSSIENLMMVLNDNNCQYKVIVELAKSYPETFNEIVRLVNYNFVLSELNDALDAIIRDNNGYCKSKIKLIKECRLRTKMNLLEAKDYVEDRYKKEQELMSKNRM